MLFCETIVCSRDSFIWLVGKATPTYIKVELPLKDLDIQILSHLKTIEVLRFQIRNLGRVGWVLKMKKGPKYLA